MTPRHWKVLTAVIVALVSQSPARAQSDLECGLLTGTLALQYQVEGLRRCVDDLHRRLKDAQRLIEYLCTSSQAHQAEINLLGLELQELARSLGQPSPDIQRSVGAEICDPNYRPPPRRGRAK